jgi:hypothetical protein
MTTFALLNSRAASRVVDAAVEPETTMAGRTGAIDAGV